MQHWTEDGTRLERTNWRDQAISLRHREWGFNCPAVDLDFLMVEYNLGKPVGIAEYKHYRARFPDLQHPTYRALAEMAGIAQLPFVIAFYWPNVWAFRVWPGNVIASEHFSAGEALTEKQYVQRLYRLRRLVLANYLRDRLNDVLPTNLEVGDFGNRIP